MTVIATATAAEVDDLGPAELLARVSGAERAERTAALDKLELALQWCVLHPPAADTGSAVWGDSGLPGLTDCDERLGGDGCPGVAAFAPEPFPRAWAAVRALEVPAWKARRVTQATHHLSREAAAHVDRRLEGRIGTATARTYTWQGPQGQTSTVTTQSTQVR